MPKPRGSRHKQLEVLSERPVLEAGQTVVRVIRACGENIYEVEDESRTKSLYQLPKRLRHIAFIRRGIYVFVRDDATRGPGKVRGDIEVIVLDRFLNSLRAESFWPPAFVEENVAAGDGLAALADDANEHSENEDSDGADDWEIGGGNPNRRRWDHVSSDEETMDEGRGA